MVYCWELAAQLITRTEDTTDTRDAQNDSNMTEIDSLDEGGHRDMVHDESGEIPKGLKRAENPTYPKGSEVIIQAEHMPGMPGANATIDSAENTIVYMITYTDTETGQSVENHKWLIEDELSPAE